MLTLDCIECCDMLCESVMGGQACVKLRDVKPTYNERLISAQASIVEVGLLNITEQ